MWSWGCINGCRFEDISLDVVLMASLYMVLRATLSVVSRASWS